MSSQYPALIVAVPLMAAMLAPLVAMRSVRWMRFMCIAVLTAVLGFAVAILVEALAVGPIHYHFGDWTPPWGIEFAIDALSGLMAVLVSFFALLTVFGVERETTQMSGLRAGAFHGLYLLLVTGLIGISITGDLFNLYVFLEISALSGYALVANGGDKARVAAFRYLIIGSVAATFWVLGLGYLYAATGTLNMADMSTLLPQLHASRAVVCGLAFIFAGMAIKMALFPLHGWQPDAYTYSPPSVIPFISSVMSKVSAYVLIRVLYTVFAARGPAEPVLSFLGWMAAFTVVAGSVMALAQRDIRRMLAYSSVAQIGYVALGMGLGGMIAMTGAILHIINHAVMKGCLFMCVAGIRARTGKTDIPDFAGLAKSMPWTCAAFTTAAISMIGLPPTCGFFSKLYLATGAVKAQAWPFVAALVISSLLNTVYFFRVIEQFYLFKPVGDQPKEEAPAAYRIPSLILATLVIAIGLCNQQLVDAVITYALPGAAW
ncbi:MAG: monovalent cation/H+ antiporter subunit D family protein [Elusimicrobiota bacterium]